jgi:hypothetical protein
MLRPAWLAIVAARFSASPVTFLECGGSTPLSLCRFTLKLQAFFAVRGRALAYPQERRGKETLVLKSPRSRDILGSFDTLVDIGVLAEKEVIQ